MRKKGSVIDIIVWAVLGVVTLFILGAFLYLFNTIGTELSDIGVVGNLNMTDITDQTFGQTNSALAIWLPKIAVIIMVMSGLSILVHNFLVKAHPVFLITYVIMTIVGIVVSAYLSNEYSDMLQNEVIGSTLQTFKGGNFIMAWLPWWVAVIGVFGSIFLFIGIIRDKNTGGVL